MFSDGVVPLIQAGVVTGRYKATEVGKLTGGFAYGSADLYKFMHDNAGIVMLDIACAWGRRRDVRGGRWKEHPTHNVAVAAGECGCCAWTVVAVVGADSLGPVAPLRRRPPTSHRTPNFALQTSTIRLSSAASPR